MDWAVMSREERDRAFNNLAHVGAEAAQAKRAEWEAASRALRARRPEHLDLPYGPAERTRWDLYPAADPTAPCLVHIHGGYWQRGSKEAFACLAEGALASGWSAALPGYTLAPEASLTRIVAELRTAFDWLAAEAASHGIAGPVIVTGWSAGGQLTALLLEHPKAAAGLAVSGVFELGPLRDVPHVNDAVRLSDAEVAGLSPMRRPGAEKPLALAYGTAELPALVASSRDFHARRAAAHLPGELVPVPHANHFTVLDGLRTPDGAAAGAAAGRVARRGTGAAGGGPRGCAPASHAGGEAGGTGAMLSSRLNAPGLCASGPAMSESTLNGRTFAALLFDMDGTIINSIAAAERAWTAWAERHGLDVAAFLPTIHGVRGIETITNLALPGVDPAAEAQTILLAEMEDVEGVAPIDGAAVFLASLPPDRWAIVTSSPRELALRRLAAAGLPVPAVLVTAEDVERGKPAPDCFLLAAERLGQKIEDCLVFEDAPAGIQAAEAAGAAVMVVTVTHRHELETRHPRIVGYGGLTAQILRP